MIGFGLNFLGSSIGMLLVDQIMFNIGLGMVKVILTIPA
jgi:hypothetical protein